MTIEEIKANKILRGPLFPEPVQVIVTIPMGSSVKLVGKGVNSGRVYEPVLTRENLASLESTPDAESFDGDPQKFRIGIRELNIYLSLT